MARQWYYMSDNRRQGPVSSSELKRLVSTGRLTGDDRVLQAGVNQWQVVRKTPGLQEIVAQREQELQAATEAIVGSKTDHDFLAAVASVSGGIADGSWISDSHDLTDREDLAGYDSARMVGGLPASHPDALQGHRQMLTGREKRSELMEKQSGEALLWSILGFFTLGFGGYIGWRKARVLIVDMQVSGLHHAIGKAKTAKIAGLVSMILWAFLMALMLAWGVSILAM